MATRGTQSRVEGCTVLTSKGSIRGSILLDKASGHVHGDTVGKSERSGETLEIRVDERTCSREDTLNLGIEVGDFVTLDPRVEHGDKGFIRSRHLDDKAGVASVIAAISALNEAGLKPSQTVTLHFSNYEEVGHGASAGLPPDLEELVSVDMAAVGEGQASDEFHTTICVKDSGGPYDNGLSLHLRELSSRAQHSVQGGHIPVLRIRW